MPPLATYRSAICRALLDVAKLSHLWTGSELKAGSAKVVHSLQRSQPKDALVLQVVMAILDENEGPVLRDLLRLEDPADTAALLTAPLAAKDARLCQVWLALYGGHYGLDADA